MFDRGCGAFDAMLGVMLGGRVPLWRDRGIRARHTGVRPGDDGRVLPTVWRHVTGLWLRRADDPYGDAEVVWEAPERLVAVPLSTRAAEHGVGADTGGD